MDTEVKEWMERAREADAWAGMVPDATLRAQWIDMAAGYRAMARERLEALLNPAPSVPPSASHQAERMSESGDPRKTRTSGLRFRKPPLYPAELWGHARPFCNISSPGARAGWRLVRRAIRLTVNPEADR